MNLLLVDDEIELLDLLAEEIELEAQGVKVLKAKNGQEALNLFNFSEVDLVITDCRMPLMDGVELAKNLKSSSVPVYMLTGHSQMYSESDIKNAGVLEVMRKPVDIDYLFSLIIRHTKVKA